MDPSIHGSDLWKPLGNISKTPRKPTQCLRGYVSSRLSCTVGSVVSGVMSASLSAHFPGSREELAQNGWEYMRSRHDHRRASNAHRPNDAWPIAPWKHRKLSASIFLLASVVGCLLGCRLKSSRLPASDVQRRLICRLSCRLRIWCRASGRPRLCQWTARRLKDPCPCPSLSALRCHLMSCCFVLSAVLSAVYSCRSLRRLSCWPSYRHTVSLLNTLPFTHPPHQGALQPPGVLGESG